MNKNIIEESSQKHLSLTCVLCNQALSSNNFYTSTSRNSMSRADKAGATRLIACKDCCKQLYIHLLKIYRNDKLKSFYHFCAALDIYYDKIILENLSETDSEFLVDRYFTILKTDIQYSSRTFIDSEQFKINETEFIKQSTLNCDLTDEDMQNKRAIFSVFHYDPFEDEILQERKKLYRDLVTMTDPAMDTDLVRQRAAIEIVRSYARADKLDREIRAIMSDAQRMVRDSKGLKDLLDAKNKEMKMITDMSRDHGFAERYATAKSKGSGTLTAAMRDIEEFNFDQGKVDLFDIKTSKSMQQVAEISMTAILKQLNLSEADYIDMLKQMRERNVQLEKDLQRSNEEKRLLYKQITKQELLKELATELRKKGLDEGEIYAAVLSEIHYEDAFLLGMKSDVLEKYNKEKAQTKTFETKPIDVKTRVVEDLPDFSKKVLGDKL